MAAATETVSTFLNRAKHIATKESQEKALNFKPRADDVMLVTPPKCGTGWMQQICHGLRSAGSMDFDDMFQVFPFIEMAHDYGYTDLQKEQVAHPRMFNTHFSYERCPKGAGKYIFVIRDPKDVSVSAYHFFNGWLFDSGSISVEDFILEIFTQRGKMGFMQEATVWQDIASWYPHRNDDNVLWLHFEDLKEDLAACVKIIAEFLDIGANDEELLALVTKQATLDFMKQHHTKFDIQAVRKARDEAIGIQGGGGEGESRKIRKGETGEAKKVLPEHVLEALDAVWKKDVEPVTGCATYAEMRSRINEEAGRPFGSAA